MQMARVFIMKEILLENDWVNYRTGCSCIGLPRYWKNEDRPGWIVITKGSMFSVTLKGDFMCKGNEKEFYQKMKEYGLVS